MYLFDVVDTVTAPDATIAVFDASAVREARLSGDKSRLASTIRTTVDAMKADRRPKAIVAFAPDRASSEVPAAALPWRAAACTSMLPELPARERRRARH